MNNDRFTILVVEDEPAIADNLLFALDKEGFESFRVATLEEARKAIGEKDFSAIVLDVGLPDGSGFDFCKEVRKTNQVPIVFLTARSDEIDRVVGLEIGADDYVTKPFSSREVIARLNAIFRRVAAHKILSSQTFRVEKEKRRIYYRGEALELSRYEYGVLELLVKNPGRVYSRQQIMEGVWESPDMSLERTVDTHIKTIRQKLTSIAPDENDLVTHRGVGYSIKDS